MNRPYPIVGALALLLAIAGCGGGGGGGGGGGNTGGVTGTDTGTGSGTGNGLGSASTAGASADTGDGSWLTFNPSEVDVTIRPDEAQTNAFSVTAHSSREIEAKVNVGIIDSAGAILPDVAVGGAGSSYSAWIKVRPDLSPGIHKGQFEVRLCYDADPLVCSLPVEGSPWFVPYTFRIVDGSKYHYPGWERAAATAGYTDDFALSEQGGMPVVVEAAFYDGVIKTWKSSDAGDTWQQLGIQGPTQQVRNFALASDGAAIYFSGGQAIAPYSRALGWFSTDVWKFDGSKWLPRTTSAAFGGRENHVMAKVGGKLFVVGGKNGSGELRDVWISTDDGVNWSSAHGGVPKSVGKVTCALDWQGSLLVIGDRVATTSDGTKWTTHSEPPPTFPKGSTQCAVQAGRLFINPTLLSGEVFNTMSTADLSEWQIEPPFKQSIFLAPGMVSIGGRLLLTSGIGTSQRSTYRTKP